MSHTKGPWVAEPRERFSSGKHITTKERMELSLVPIATCDVEWDEPFASEQRANLALILAAPELLELLKRTTKWIEGFSYGAPCPEDGVNLVNEANSIIAKSTGAA